jgi:UDP-N-acetylmuramyl pentapeptide synthase
MRRLFSYTLAVTALATAVVAAQKVTTPEELDKAMKRMDTESFWTANKKDDAVTLLKDSIAKVTAVEQSLNAPMPDQQAILGAFKQVGATCAACHKQYREQDENQQYRLKTGSI